MVLGRWVVGWGPLQARGQGSPRPGGTFQPGPGPRGAPAQADQGEYPDVRDRESLAPGAALSLASAGTAGPVAGHGAGGDERSPGRVSAGDGRGQRKGPPRREEGRAAGPHLSRSGSRRSPLGRHTGRPRPRSRTGLRAGRAWSRRRPPLENTQRVGQGGRGVSGGGRRGQREEGKGRQEGGREGRGGPWASPSGGRGGHGPLPLGGHPALPSSSPRGPLPPGSCPHPPAL